MFSIKRALISCTDKTGLDVFGKFLVDKGVEILSTGGTAKLLRDSGVPVIEVSDYTGSPEILDGRVKTLHPKIHGGVLAIRDNANHQKQIQENGIGLIDLLVVNLYAFEKTIANPQATLQDAIENIDIGGPSMMRSAAKNHQDVVVVSDPSDYARVMKEWDGTGELSKEFRFELACKVFETTAKYDTAISSYLNQQLEEKTEKITEKYPNTMTVQLKKMNELRYGENPHQKAALYKEEGVLFGVTKAKQLQGKALSFNNYMDMESAWNCCMEFNTKACVIVKHMNPCGVALADELSDAFLRARAGDPVSSFGGIVAFNRHVDRATAVIMAETFFEVIIAPGYDEDALEIFGKKKNLRIMTLNDFSDEASSSYDYRKISGGFLVQDRDAQMVALGSCEVATKCQPSDVEMSDLDFAWKVVKHVKSNAIVFVKDKQILGVGAGQMSRVDSVKIAARKAKESFEKNDVLQGAVMASDAFFPFRDGVDLAASFGIKSVVQPGGSMRDKEVVEACDEHGVSMVLTGMRHFRH